jgi:predicted glycosyltransferase
VSKLAGRRRITLVVIARDEGQRRRFLAPGLPGVLVPDHLVDGVGLVAAADFALGLGGTMTREAVALGTPAYTLSTGERAAVEASLLRDGRLNLVGSPDDVVLRKKETRTVSVAPRDPRIFVDRLIALASRGHRPARLGRLMQSMGDERDPPSLV